MTPRDGRDGKDGRDGPQGPSGDMGPRGFRGLTGEKGLTGDRGEQGPKGDKGDPGESIKGETGARGIRGEPGINGKDGAPGARGPAGPQGRMGPMPEHEWDGTRLRFEIEVGVWGAWTDLQGPKGETGARGAQGESAGGGSFYGGFPAEWDAPRDGQTYGRRDGEWAVDSGGVPEAPIDGSPYWRKDGAWQVAVSGGGATWGAIVGTLTDQGDLADALALKADSADLGSAASHAASDFATAAQGATADSAVQPGDLATVAFSGAYGDLSGRPSLATVATSGAYSDLTGKPTLGTAAAAATTDFATAAQGTKADSAVQPGSAALTGTPTAPTQSANDNSTKIATTAYVDTLGGLKANLASPTFTGDPKAPTPSTGDDDTSIATTAFVQATVTKITLQSKSADYTTVLSDKGTGFLHPAADTTARTFTIDSNANVAYDVGTTLTFVNQHGAGVLTIACTSDTMRLAGTGATGNRTLAADGIATALKITSTEWLINGTGLT